jgi:precorrin-3B synthase
MRRGWCPTVHAPMPSGDGLLVRVKPPLGCLSPAQARALAAAAARDGNGVIELTSRANLQVRGLAPDSAGRFARAMVDAGLAAPDPAVEGRRSVAVLPLPDPATARVAAALEGALAQDDALAALPAKFGFAVALPAIAADVRLHPAAAGWAVWPDGAARAAHTAAPVAAALRVAHAFLTVAQGARRMRDVPAASVFAAARLRPELPAPAPPLPPPTIGALVGGFGVGLPFGAMDAATLDRLAACGPLHVTPWRALIIAAAAAPPDDPALILDPADPRRALTACPGRPACASAQADVRADALLLAGRFPGLALHVSGCAKGCAQPRPAPLTLVAGADGYALVRDGTTADPPVAHGLSLAQLAAMIAA